MTNQSNYIFQKLHISLSKQAKIHIPTTNQQDVTALWKFLKVKFFCEVFSKNVKDKALCFLLVKNMAFQVLELKTFQVLEFEVTRATLVKITGHQNCYFVLLIHKYLTLINYRRKYQ